MGMSDLAACAVRSFKDLSANNDSAADTGSESNHDHVLLAFAAAFPLLAESCDICVITCTDFHIKELAEFILYVRLTPVKVDSDRYDTCHDRTRYTYADTGYIFFLVAL